MTFKMASVAQSRHPLLLGAHFSIAKGLHHAVTLASAYECTAVQIFTKNARTWKERFLTNSDIAAFNRVRKNTGMDRLKLIHLNDSKKPLGSRVDRHEHIGRGHIGRRAFELNMNDPRLMRVPKIFETPNISFNIKNIESIDHNVGQNN